MDKKKNSVLTGLIEQAQVPVDDIPANLTENEFVIPADVVILLGEGDKEKGFAYLQDLVDSTRANAPV